MSRSRHNPDLNPAPPPDPIVQDVGTTLSPNPLHRCWQPNFDQIRCTKRKGHAGLHSWEPPRAPPPGWTPAA